MKGRLREVNIDLMKWVYEIGERRFIFFLLKMSIHIFYYSYIRVGDSGFLDVWKRLVCARRQGVMASSRLGF